MWLLKTKQNLVRIYMQKVHKDIIHSILTHVVFWAEVFTQSCLIFIEHQNHLFLKKKSKVKEVWDNRVLE